MKRLILGSSIAVIVFFVGSFSLYGQTILNTSALMIQVDSGFVCNVEIGGDISSGNSEVVDLSGGCFVGFGGDKGMIRLVGGGNLLSEDTSVIQQGLFGQLRVNFYLNTEKKIDVFVFSQWQDNSVLLVDERFLLGGGFRWNLFNKKFKIDTSIGSFFEQEEYLPDAAEFVAKKARTSFTIVVQKEGDNSTMQFSSYIQHDYRNYHDYRLFNEFTINFQIHKKLYFSFDVISRYDNRPHGGLKNFDLGLICGLGVAL